MKGAPIRSGPRSRSTGGVLSDSYNDYARETVRHMLILQGWLYKTACLNTTPVPAHVRDGAFNTIRRHDRLYTSCITLDQTPEQAAQTIQNRDWQQAWENR